MGRIARIARTVLSWLSPAFWTAAITLTVLHLVWPLWVPGIGGLIVVLTGLGLAGILSGAVQATHDHDIAALGQALAGATRTGDQLQTQARGVLSLACPRPGPRPGGNLPRLAPPGAPSALAG